MVPPLRRGLSLAEVVLALALLATTVLSVMAIFTIGIRLSSQNRDSVAATQLGNSLLEKLVSGNVTLPTSAVFDGSLGHAPVAGFPPAPYPKQTVDQNEYTFWVNSSPVAGMTEIVMVVVEVRWHGGKKVRIQSFFYRP